MTEFNFSQYAAMRDSSALPLSGPAVRGARVRTAADAGRTSGAEASTPIGLQLPQGTEHARPLPQPAGPGPATLRFSKQLRTFRTRGGGNSLSDKTAQVICNRLSVCLEKDVKDSKQEGDTNKWLKQEKMFNLTHG